MLKTLYKINTKHTLNQLKKYEILAKNIKQLLSYGCLPLKVTCTLNEESKTNCP